MTQDLDARLESLSATHREAQQSYEKACSLLEQAKTEHRRCKGALADIIRQLDMLRALYVKAGDHAKAQRIREIIWPHRRDGGGS